MTSSGIRSLGLRDDALRSRPGGFELRISLPWIRSLPLAGLRDLVIVVDGREVAVPRALLDGHWVALSELSAEQGAPGGPPSEHWWHLQDRLLVSADGELAPGVHRVLVRFAMMVPHLPSPNGPLVLPFRLEADLELDRVVSPDVAGVVGMTA